LRFPSSDTIKLARLAVQSGIWQLYEIYEGEFKRNLVPREKVPVSEYLGLQRRFSHLTEEQVETIQRHVEESWSE